jgi:glycosyltransferase involved in cell wall biosynthesis
VLFVGHDASRSGAPVVLRSLLRWLGHHTSAEVELVVQRGGELMADYQRLAPTRVLDHGARHGAGLVAAGLRSVRPTLPGWIDSLATRSTLGRTRADVVVANTLAALDLAVRGAPSHVPVVCHVHELDGVASRVLPADGAARNQALDRVTRFVAAGQAVGSMLVDRWGVAPARVTVVDEFIDRPSVAPGQADTFRAQLGIDPGQVLVASAGAVGARKGTDHFVDLAATLADHPAAPTFVWAGGDRSSTAWAEAVHDIAAADLGDRVRMVGPVADTAGLMAAADVFVTTAREDPYPLVALEAGAGATPVAGFDSGGATEVAAAGGHPDLMVAVGDVLGLADRVSGLLTDGAERERLGDRLSTWVHSTHLTEHLAPHVWQAIVETA